MSIAGPIALYLAAVALCGVLALPLLRAAFGNSARLPLLSLGFVTGAPLALALLAAVARWLPDYAAALPLALLLLATIGGALRRRQTRQQTLAAAAPDWDRGADLMLLAGFAVVLAASVLLRSRWPALTWDNSAPWAGVEKLFNLSLIQAYTFGRGLPPENLWHAGQAIDYPVLSHALPGLAAWGWRTLTGDAGAAGVLFVFSDAFLFALAALAVAAWAQALLALGRVARGPSLLIACGVGLGVLLATSGKAMALVFASLSGGAATSWLQLQEQAVAYTFSQYPYWTLLLGDHHAFQKVACLQVAFFGAMALLLTARRTDPARALLAGALAAALAQWHSGSVLLALVVLVPAAAGVVGWQLAGRRRAEAGATLVNLLASGVVAAALALPGWAARQQPEMRWYLVETAAASPWWNFIQAQTGPLLFVVAGAVAALVATGSTEPARWRTLLLPAAAIAVLIAAALGQGGIAVALGCAALTLLALPGRSDATAAERAPLVILAAAGFALWVLPEIVVGDTANRHVVEWKRWQMTMRFWLEGYTLVPFLAALAWGPAFAAALERRGFAQIAAVAASVVGAAWIAVHALATVDRTSRWPDRAGLDGFEFLARRHACDAAVAEHLRSLPGRVQIGELCGTGEVVGLIPTEYSWAGRIAAFSGRPGVCGWSKHAFVFSPRARADAHTGPWSWVRFREYERAITVALGSAAAAVPAAPAAETLQRFGVTHVVAGGEERRLFPGLTAEAMARSFGGKLSFADATGCGVVELGAAAASAK